MKDLRPHQIAAIDLLRASLRSGKRRPMLQLATGAGKTVIAASIIRNARQKGKRVTFVVDALSLIDQTVTAFYDEGLINIGVIQADHPMKDYSRPIQVASVQTLRRRGMPETDMVIVDEAHARDQWLTEWMLDNPKTVVVGLSATPWAKGLGNLYDDLIQPITMQELVDLGYLCPIRVFAASKPDLSKVKTVAGEYHEGQLSEVMCDDGLVADVIRTWRDIAGGRPSLAFAVDCAHAQRIQERFAAVGISWGYIDAYTERADRARAAKALKAGEIAGIVSVGTMIKGVDLPFVSCISDCAPTKSEMRHVQKLGRGMRIDPMGTPDLIVLDHASNCLRLGFPTDIYHEKLCTKKKGEKLDVDETEAPPPKPKECPSCGQLRSKGVKKCPNCGFEPKAFSDIEEAPGELAEVKRKQVTIQDKQKFWSMAQHVDFARGKGGKLAAALYKSRFGVWPRGLSDSRTQPDPAFLAYETSRRIAYAKRRANG